MLEQDLGGTRGSQKGYPELPWMGTVLGLEVLPGGFSSSSAWL